MMRQWFLVILWALAVSPLLGDVAVPDTRYLALSYVEWKMGRSFSFLDIEIWLLFLTGIFIIVSVVVGIWKRRYKRMFVLLLLELSLAVMLILHIGRQIIFTINPSFNNKYVAPQAFESYEEYLKRVDCMDRHICLKCDTQMQRRLYGWHCPKCELDYFVCEKCGGAKEEAYYMGRYLYCPKCGAGRRGSAESEGAK